MNDVYPEEETNGVCRREHRLLFPCSRWRKPSTSEGDGRQYRLSVIEEVGSLHPTLAAARAAVRPSTRLAFSWNSRPSPTRASTKMACESR